ncbi:hypothetical protein [Pseudonocardia endophytica]|uniref:hypothetical protein n=1 Tax=Pseudonocardia endophytica TaxID=401976 RepID=UPI00104E2DB4|nr:hypothetical protein [Pseudonocardia endophytica]
MLDAGVAAWMSATGPWFDETSALTRVITLGGHHVILFWVAVAAVATLLSAAVLTANFTTVGRAAGTVLTAAIGLSVVALAGLASVLALAATVVLLVSVLGRAVR